MILSHGLSIGWHLHYVSCRFIHGGSLSYGLSTIMFVQIILHKLIETTTPSLSEYFYLTHPSNSYNSFIFNASTWAISSIQGAFPCWFWMWYWVSECELKSISWASWTFTPRLLGIAYWSTQALWSFVRSLHFPAIYSKNPQAWSLWMLEKRIGLEETETSVGLPQQRWYRHTLVVGLKHELI